LPAASRLPPIAVAVAALSCRSATLDGELVMTRADGSIDFHGLFGAAGARCEGVAYWAFDLLELDGEALRSLPLIERKRRLDRLIARARSGCHAFGSTISRSRARATRRAIASHSLQHCFVERTAWEHGLQNLNANLAKLRCSLTKENP
jgi:ATP-dependent DNA ligase